MPCIILYKSNNRKPRSTCPGSQVCHVNHCSRSFDCSELDLAFKVIFLQGSFSSPGLKTCTMYLFFHLEKVLNQMAFKFVNNFEIELLDDSQVIFIYLLLKATSRVSKNAHFADRQ